MKNIVIREYQKTDLTDLMEICYRTGYMGEDLTGKNIFNDKKLFGYLFCLYYPYYENENCFVAVTEDRKIAGYIIGTADSRKQCRRFISKMSLRILSRLLFYTMWRSRESFLAVLHFIRSLFKEHSPRDLFSAYPAHLHINVLPDYQGAGVGKKLLDRFENHIKGLNVPGIHLNTSNYNKKAVSFYLKEGYKVISENVNLVWPGVINYKQIMFGKKFD